MSTTVRCEIPLAETLRQAASEDDFAFLILPAPDQLGPEVTAFADGDLLRSAFVELFRYAAVAGEKVHVGVSREPDEIELTIRHSGGVAPEVASMIHRGDSPHQRELAPIESRPQDLLNIRYLVEAAGASLKLSQEDGNSTHTVRVPTTGPTATKNGPTKGGGEASVVPDVLSPVGSLSS